MDYTPLSSFEGLPSPHDAQPTSRDPWFVWAIGASPLVPLLVILLLATTPGWAPSMISLAAIAATSLACVNLARRDQQAIAELGSTRPTDARLALAPGVYLLVRAARRAMGPHRGNPLHPLVLHVAASFALGYYFTLVLMGIASIVNKGFY